MNEKEKFENEKEKFENAKYWVGCNTESADRIYFDLNSVYKALPQHNYIAAFNAQGNWVTEGQVNYSYDTAQGEMSYLEFNY